MKRNPTARNSYLLLLLLLSLLIFPSCNKEEQLGVEVQPSADELNVFFNDTFTVSAYTVRDDSIRTDETLINLIGCINDPVFGRVSAGVYTQFRLPDNNVSFGTNPVADSIILSLAYSGHYGDSVTALTLNVFEIDQDFYADSAYYASSRISTSKYNLAGVSFVPDFIDSVAVDGSNQAPQLRVKLNKALAQKFIQASGTSSLADNTNFLTFFKGLMISVTPTSANGQIIYFNLLSAFSRMTLYYHNDADTLKYNFVINDKCARFNSFNTYNYSYASPAFRQQINGDTAAGNDRLFIQAMGVARVKLKFPDLTDLVSSGKVAVNKAELVICADKNESYSEPIPEKLTLVRIKEDGTLAFLPDALLGDLYFGGTHNSSGEYRFNVSKYIQEYLLHDGLGDKGIYLTVSGAAIKGNRVVVNGHKALSGNLRLEITYTKIN